MSIVVKERNKQVKRVLSDLFGAKNVSVIGGKGTAYGWCDITINARYINGKRSGGQYTQEEQNLINSINNAAEQAIRNIEFYSYIDDMGGAHKEYIIQVSLD